ncbi:MAG: SMC-Scp complex subunit ScpB, partial [Acidimicrobiia bacterium]
MKAEIRRAIEAILFVADEPVPTADLALLLERPASELEAVLEEMSSEYSSRGIVIRSVASGWRMSTHPSVSQFLERFVTEQRNPKVSQASLETLAVIAYRQPISRAQIAEIRGVSADSAVRTLIARGMVGEVARDPGPGQAVLYGTTNLFLERMGINTLDELPRLPEFMPDTESV